MLSRVRDTSILGLVLSRVRVVLLASPRQIFLAGQ